MSWLEPLYKFTKNIFNYKLIILLVVIFLAIAAYYYSKIVKPNLNKKYVANKEFVEQNQEQNQEVEQKTATLYFFYTNWCPLCKKARTEWTALKNDTEGTVKNVNIVFKEIDCDNDTATADRFNITGYPTIKLVYDNKTYEYDAKPDKNILIQFLDSVL